MQRWQLNYLREQVRLTSHDAMLTVILPWHEAKLFIERATSIEHGTLHLVLGFLAWLAIALVWRRALSSWKPLLALLALIIWNEFVDLRVERWPQRGSQFGDSAQDLALTMLVPTAIMLAARWAPWLFVHNKGVIAMPDDGTQDALYPDQQS
jgi:hypothetical protein